MNLSVKNNILVFILFLLYISCDESSEVGLELRENIDIEARYIDIPLTASNIYFDSVRTDLSSLIFGQYDNPDFGKTKAVAYTQFSPEITSPDIVSTNLSLAPNDESILDSIRIYLKYSYIHGEEIGEEQEISVRLIEDTLFAGGIYLSSNVVPVSLVKGAIGFNRFTVGKKEDTLLTISLTQQYGNLIFNLAKQGVPDRELRETTKGIAFDPGENNKIIVGFDLDDQSSKMVLYYHNPNDEDSLKLEFRLRFDSPLSKHYSNYSIDRSSSALSGVQIKNLNEFNINNKIYWQSASGIYPIIDLEPFNNFVDTAENIIFNKVQMIIGPIDNSGKKYINPPGEAVYYFAKEDNNINASGIETAPLDNVILKDNAYYGETEAPASYRYDSIITSSYQGTSTVFFQDLALKKYDVKRVVVFPSVASTFNQAIINKDNFRLKVFYTKYLKK